MNQPSHGCSSCNEVFTYAIDRDRHEERVHTKTPDVVAEVTSLADQNRDVTVKSYTLRRWADALAQKEK